VRLFSWFYWLVNDSVDGAECGRLAGSFWTHDPVLKYRVAGVAEQKQVAEVAEQDGHGRGWIRHKSRYIKLNRVICSVVIVPYEVLAINVFSTSCYTTNQWLSCLSSNASNITLLIIKSIYSTKKMLTNFWSCKLRPKWSIIEKCVRLQLSLFWSN